MSHLPLSLMNRLMNRLNKTESAGFIFWMLYFQRIPLSDNIEIDNVWVFFLKKDQNHSKIKSVF